MRSLNERDLAIARGMHDPQTFEAARVEGRSMTFEQAVAYALEDDDASPAKAASGLAVIESDRGCQRHLGPHETPTHP